ncbi:MAG: RNA-binding protein [Bacteroidia bacterium]|nr:RNA-binding protein [Bacteroidia bacterium]
MNIFVSNLNFRIRERALAEMFKPYGEVTKVRIIKDRETKRSKGYGFVEMPNDEEAKKAIEALNGSVHMDRTINVQVATGIKHSEKLKQEGQADNNSVTSET